MLLREFFDENLDEGINDPGIFKAVFMAGPPGAGKNTVISALGLKAKGLKLQDVDKVIGYLKTTRAGYDHTDSGYMRGLDTTRRRQNLLQQEMLGLIINTTGRDAEAIMTLNRQLMEYGYDTFMVFVEVDEHIAWARAQNRTKNATDPADAGRPVDKAYFDTAYPGSMLNRDFYALMFGDQFALVTNNEEREIKEDDEADEQTFDSTLRVAYKKIQRFLNKPLNQVAQQAVNAARAKRFGQ